MGKSKIEEFVDELVVQEFNAVGAGNVVGYTGPVGASTKKGKKTLWSNPPTKGVKVNKESSLFKGPRDVQPAKDDINAPIEYPAFGGDPNMLHTMNGLDSHYNNPPAQMNPELVHGASGDVKRRGRTVSDKMRLNRKEMNGEIPGDLSRSVPERPMMAEQQQTEQHFFFHATNDVNLGGIIETGVLIPHSPSYGTDQDVWPDGSTQDRIYFGTSPKHVEPFYPEHGRPILLRVPATAASFKKERGTGDWYTTKPITADKIQYLDPDTKSWQPVLGGRDDKQLKFPFDESVDQTEEVKYPDARYDNAKQYEEDRNLVKSLVRVPLPVVVALGDYKIPNSITNVLSDPSVPWDEALEAINDIWLDMVQNHPETLRKVQRQLANAEITMRTVVLYLIQSNNLKLPPIKPEEWEKIQTDYSNYIQNRDREEEGNVQQLENVLKPKRISPSKWAYHVTMSKFLPSIVKHGLIPKGRHDARVWFAAAPGDYAPRSPDMALLRFPWPPTGWSKVFVSPFDPVEYFINSLVPSAALEILTIKGWTSLQTYIKKPLRLYSVDTLPELPKSKLVSKPDVSFDERQDIDENVLDQMHHSIKTPGTRAPYGTPTYIQREGIEGSKVTLYHGTCEDSAQAMLKSGWSPSQVPVGGNMGQPEYLYLTNEPANALWFAEEKGCNTILRIKIPSLEFLGVDPEDGIEDTVEAELAKSYGPAYLVLKRSLPASAFSIYKGKIALEDNSQRREMGILKKVKKNLDKKAYTLHDPPSMGISITNPKLKDRPGKNQQLSERVDSNKLHKQTFPRVVFRPASDSGLQKVPVTVEVRDTTQGRIDGLMHRKSLKEGHGMIFVFPFPMQQKFWMKNTHVPLDMIWITPERRVLGVSENTTPLSEKQFFVTGDSLYVVEVPAGFARKHGITRGTMVEFHGIPLVGKR